MNWPLDLALARGVDITIDGKEWTFSPLKVRDWADVGKRARSNAVSAYLDVTKSKHDIDPRRWRDGLCAIVFSAQVENTFDALHDPSIRREMLMRSLKHKHPDVTPEQVDKILEDEHHDKILIDLVTLMSLGASDPNAESESAGNPTVGGRPTISEPTSAPLSPDSDSQSTKSET